MAYKAEGRLHKVFDTEQKTASFQAREFVIEVADGKFPQMVKFQLTQDKCTLIDDYAEGDQIAVEFDLRGREWNDKYFTNLNAWRIARADAQGDGAAPVEASQPGPGAAATASFDDDIPF
jgi:hypothetical protein